MADEPKHTPGPWNIKSRFLGPLVIEANGEPLAEVGGETFAVVAANADLIAVAPDMYEALDQLIDDMRDGLSVCQAAKDQAIAALAKARGKRINHD